MDWTTLIITLLGGTTVASTVQAIRFWNKTKRKEEADTQLKEIEAEHAKMDLASDYMAKVKELSELNYQATLQNGKDNAEIIRKVDAIAEEQKLMGSFLNGEYQAFKEKQTRKPRKPKEEKQ